MECPAEDIRVNSVCAGKHSQTMYWSFFFIYYVLEEVLLECVLSNCSVDKEWLPLIVVVSSLSRKPLFSGILENSRTVTPFALFPFK